MKGKDRAFRKNRDSETELERVERKGKIRIVLLVTVFFLTIGIGCPLSHFVMPREYWLKREYFNRIADYAIEQADSLDKKPALGVLFFKGYFRGENVPEEIQTAAGEVNAVLQHRFQEVRVTDDYVVFIYGRYGETWTRILSRNMIVFSRSGKRIRGDFYSRWLFPLGDGWYNTVYHW